MEVFLFRRISFFFFEIRKTVKFFVEEDIVVKFDLSYIINVIVFILILEKTFFLIFVNFNINVFRFMIYFFINLGWIFLFEFLDEIIVKNSFLIGDNIIIIFFKYKRIEYLFVLDLELMIRMEESRVFMIYFIDFVGIINFLEYKDEFSRRGVLFVFILMLF